MANYWIRSVSSALTLQATGRDRSRGVIIAEAACRLDSLSVIEDAGRYLIICLVFKAAETNKDSSVYSYRPSVQAAIIGEGLYIHRSATIVLVFARV